jgi:eukaryotic-like serine/threonine-protein kinase
MTHQHGNEPAPLAFERLAVLAVSPRGRVELCRVVSGESYGAVVAVKRLPIDLASDADLGDMFRDEIRIAAALDHQNVTRVLGWGEDERGLYLATEFVRGVSLGRLMRTVFLTGEAFTERLIVYLAAAACAGLAAAHELRAPSGDFLNLVHRDLTPGNILLGFEGSVKLTDFGLAKTKHGMTHTAQGITKGEPSYMSPEQVCGLPLDARSDVYALGVVLYELFAQRRPYAVTTVEEALDKVVRGPAIDLGAPCPRIDRALVALVNRCLAKERGERWQSSREVHDKLEEWLALHGYHDNKTTLARFVRRNAMRQMRWLDRALAGELVHEQAGPTPLELSRDEIAALEAPPPERPPDPAPVLRVKEPDTAAIPLVARAPGEGEEVTTARRPRAPTTTITTAQTRARDSRTAQPMVTPDLAITLSEEPSTIRAPLASGLAEVATRIEHGRLGLAAEAQQAAEIARAAAKDAIDAAQHAQAAADRLERALEASRMAQEAMRLAAQGDRAGALAELQRAQALFDSAVGGERR